MLWVIPMVKKSVKNYIEWCSQSTKRLIFGHRYEDTIVLSYYDIMIVWSYMLHTLLYYIVLYYTILYHIILYICLLCYIILYYMIQLHNVFNGVIL